jgi:23S rRNA pseudouridine1911/1915/1917 synthase
VTQPKGPVSIVCRSPGPLGAILPRLGADAAQALAEGRIFIGRRRVNRETERVEQGDEVIMFPPRGGSSERARVLAEREGMVAAYKPAEMPTIADHHGHGASLEREVAALVGEDRGAALHPTSRLDVGVSGVVLFATTEAARTSLARARAEGRYLRRYVAVAAKAPEPSSGRWTAPIGRDANPRHRRAFGAAAKPADTAYALVATAGPAVLLSIEPRTGRTHQIRVHAAHAGCPLMGDAAYGGPSRIVSATGAVSRMARIALHAAWIDVPVAEGTWRVEAPIPEDLARIWELLSGDPSAWARAVARW